MIYKEDFELEIACEVFERLSAPPMTAAIEVHTRRRVHYSTVKQPAFRVRDRRNPIGLRPRPGLLKPAFPLTKA